MKSYPMRDGSRRTLNKQPEEARLVKRAFQKLGKNPNVTVRCSVPLLGRCVDLAYLHESCLVTVEFKLRDWRRALRQARDHRLATDYAYVCMPRREIPTAMRQEFIRLGVGLSFYSNRGDWPFEIAVQAPRSCETWSVARAWLCGYLRSVER